MPLWRTAIIKTKTMKKIYDKDLGIDSDFVATGETDEEVIKNSLDHIRKEFPNELNKVRPQMKAAIKTE